MNQLEIDHAHAEDVVRYTLEQEGDTCAWSSFPYRGGLRFIIPGHGRAEAANALTACGYNVRLEAGRAFIVTGRWRPKTASAAFVDGHLTVECPLGDHSFTAPADAAGALVDCDTCPWRGVVGDPEHPATDSADAHSERPNQ